MRSVCLGHSSGLADGGGVRPHTEKTIRTCESASARLQPLCRAVQEFERGSDAAATTPLWGANPVLSWGISEMP